jgi:hypothetical protein
LLLKIQLELYGAQLESDEAACQVSVHCCWLV